MYAHLKGTKGFPLVKADYSWMGDLGNLGVRVFFVISGFLITTLLLRELDKTGRISLKLFYFRRTMRIFPAAYVFLGIVCVMVLFGLVEATPLDLITGFAYLSNYYPERSTIVVHLWSLGVEEQFYLLWPAVLAFLPRRRAFLAAGAVLVVSPLLRFGLLWIPEVRPYIPTAFPTIADPLAAGCLLAGLREWLFAKPLYMRVLKAKWFWLVPLSVVALNAAPWTKVNKLILQTVINILIAVCVDHYTRFPGGLTGRILNAWPLQPIGVLSYSLYLWQQMFLDRLGTQWWHAFPVNLALAFACGFLSYKLVEKPMLDLRARLEASGAGKRFLFVPQPSRAAKAAGAG